MVICDGLQLLVVVVRRTLRAEQGRRKEEMKIKFENTWLIREHVVSDECQEMIGTLVMCSVYLGW